MKTDTAKASSNGHRLVDSDLFRDVIGHFASGVTVITTRQNENNFGITASAVTSLSVDPPMLLVCANKKTGTCQAISASKTFGVNILHEDQGDLALQFAKPNTDKFKDTPISYGELGEPLLKDVLANLECRVVEEVTGGTHSVFLAEVQNARVEKGMPLTYFRGKFGHFKEANDERVYRQIRKLILTRDFKADQMLDLEELAYQLDVPRQAVYYAMTRLETEGLVNREEEDHYIVTPLDAGTLNDALDTRCALEVAAVEQTANRLSDKELTELQKRLQATLFQANENPKTDLYIEANTAFHDYTVAVTKNPTLLDAYRRVTAEAVMSSALRAALEAGDEMAQKELALLARDHIALTEAFEAGDVKEAKQVILQHTANAKRLGRYLIDSAGGKI
ncbi:flavin reductase (DIM6/NTAB) family NADH-FMN oxidoreductase RutF [Scopulibacillus darangshiensis]|uniref:Flavin reductase (DIM6/NTAB) family NADH-FMN oxidoreductase RutF n=1 Tax=Scopulibacillus darangshiensis TaxID=442528 RepID=A0A4R2P3S6_9BACL|nr:flavin reductase [Scopulibacillus darangshiensis]TCP29439.1 flavin reductase (DIM6/NTAB) family NADH-FMN oxidoreductase RutF [Scopulibacillus darangshiensis]